MTNSTLYNLIDGDTSIFKSRLTRFAAAANDGSYVMADSIGGWEGLLHNVARRDLFIKITRGLI